MYFRYIFNMSQNLENFLRQIMTSFGGIVERLIGSAHKAKMSVGTRSGIQPIISLEGQIEQNKIQDMISFATERIYLSTIPLLQDHATLEIGEGEPLFTQRFVQQKARSSVYMDLSNMAGIPQGDATRGYVIKGSAGSLPFHNDFFDYICARLTTNLQGDIVKSVKEIGRVLIPGGQGVFIDFHPYGLYAKHGSDRMLSVESTIRGIEDYYKICRTSGLRIISIKEAFIDESFRPMFAGDAIQSYRNIKGSPLILFVYFFKPKT
ncbi:MAG: hypothetical protein COS89_03975 [Deltaproteobacteria bacterium CG07_land_8_20_14_0_80_38_7]|nr:MAG: hypothetical protein COS89_03975 [Deltaproteobacteria bacterium CG07_land_8_20_14_0_80_38_7]